MPTGEGVEEAGLFFVGGEVGMAAGLVALDLEFHSRKSIQKIPKPTSFPYHLCAERIGHVRNQQQEKR